jgi:hypothetical protein
MKLRIQGNSLRIRVTRSDLALLVTKGRIANSIYFAFDECAKLQYALEHKAHRTSPALRYQPPEIAVVLPTEATRVWAQSDQVGIYAAVDFGARGVVDLIVEKDFACLDLSDAENVDTFPNPNAGSVF